MKLFLHKLALLGAFIATPFHPHATRLHAIEPAWLFTGSPVDCAYWEASRVGNKCEMLILFSSDTPPVTCTSQPKTAEGMQAEMCAWDAPKNTNKGVTP